MNFKPLVIALFSIIFFICANPALAQENEKDTDKLEPYQKTITIFLNLGFDNNQAVAMAAIYYLGTGDYSKAEKAAQTIIAHEAGAFLNAEAVFRKANYQKAYRLYEQLAEKYPENGIALLRMGLISIFREDYQLAEEQISKAASLEKKNPEVELALGRLYIMRGDAPAKAIASLRNAFAGYKENKELNFELGSIYYEKGSYKEAEYFFDRAIQLGAREEKHRLAFAKSKYYQGKNDEALVEIRKVLRRNKRSAEANYFLGAIQMERKKYSRAVQAFQKADKMGKGFGDSRYYLGKIKSFQGLHHEAMQDLLQFRMDRISQGKGYGPNFDDSMKTILDIESVLKVERLPHQIPGSKEGMVEIRGGELFFGWDGVSGRTDEQRREVKRFLMDEAEVTAADYAVFVKATSWNLPKISGRGEAIARLSWNNDSREPSETAAPLPMVFVSWQDALAYAAWCGKRLPTEVEWEFAAHGRDISKPYPWGDGKPNSDKVIFSRPEGAVPAREGYLGENGLYNICGNVAEWCLGEPEKNKKPYRGGHWRSGAEDLKVFIRGELSRKATNAFVGFRCAADITEEK